MLSFGHCITNFLTWVHSSFFLVTLCSPVAYFTGTFFKILKEAVHLQINLEIDLKGENYLFFQIWKALFHYLLAKSFAISSIFFRFLYFCILVVLSEKKKLRFSLYCLCRDCCFLKLILRNSEGN